MGLGVGGEEEDAGDEGDEGGEGAGLVRLGLGVAGFVAIVWDLIVFGVGVAFWGGRGGRDKSTLTPGPPLGARGLGTVRGIGKGEVAGEVARFTSAKS